MIINFTIVCCENNRLFKMSVLLLLCKNTFCTAGLMDFFSLFCLLELQNMEKFNLSFYLLDTTACYTHTRIGTVTVILTVKLYFCANTLMCQMESLIMKNLCEIIHVPNKLLIFVVLSTSFGNHTLPKVYMCYPLEFFIHNKQYLGSPFEYDLKKESLS